MERVFVDQNGKLLGVFIDGGQPLVEAVEVPTLPSDGLQSWNGQAWVDSKASVVAKIKALEASVTMRTLREAALGDATAVQMLRDNDNAIKLLRQQVAALDGTGSVG